MHNHKLFSLVKVSGILLSGLFLASCATNPNSTRNSTSMEKNKVPVSACVGNAYLQKYGCSTRRINQAAKSGDPDAQYALGYMYYYGIGTIRDKETAKMWIDRAAKQGQPLAKKAEELIANGQQFHNLHHQGNSGGSTAYSNSGGHSSRGRSATNHEPTPSMEELNNRTPNKSLNEVLPNYGKKPVDNKKSNAVIKSLQKKSKEAEPENANPGKLEPITQHDPRLGPKTSPITTKAQRGKHRRFASRSLSDRRVYGRSSTRATSRKRHTQSALAKKGRLRRTPRNMVRARGPQLNKQRLMAMKRKHPRSKTINQVPNTSHLMAKSQADRTFQATPKMKSQVPATAAMQKASSSSPIAIQAQARNAMTAIEMQMMEVPKKHFALQLLGGHNLSAMKAFIAKNNLEGRAHFYSAQLNHEKWYMLVYGNYPNLEAARMAMRNLPPTLRRLHPWIKSYRIIHDEIRLRRIVT